jgi:SAM-dependent methyltransferase
MASDSGTWHYGLVARWWAEFNLDGPEIEYFAGLVREHGQPALDVGCGTGRVLLPLLAAGLDVDGADVSRDMLALCRERAAREGLVPSLHEQPMHELRLQRTYRTAFMCGAFGIGGDHEHDRLALRRAFEHLEPGGVLAIDLPGARDDEEWRIWAERAEGNGPEPWPVEGDRRVASDGTLLELRSRRAAVDAAREVTTLEIRVSALDARGVLLAEEEYALQHSMYSERQLPALLEEAGFENVHGVDGYRLAAEVAPVRVVLGMRPAD